jgi:hypothetical protein
MNPRTHLSLEILSQRVVPINELRNIPLEL